jgi:hypothetical protein
MAQPAIQDSVRLFDTSVTQRLADTNFQQVEPDVFYLDDEPGDDAVANNPNVPTDEEYGDMIPEPKPDVDDLETYDKYLNAEFIVNRADGEAIKARGVRKRIRTDTGELVGREHTSPLFDTRAYECVLDDGTIDRYTANIIAENLYSQCDSEGRSMKVLDEIVDHRSDNSAVTIADGYTTGRAGNRIPTITTRGWQLLCQWRDGSSDWIPLVELKDSNPVELAEYAVANKIQEEPAFKWWVSTVLRKRNRIIAKLKSRYWSTSHKFGVRLPKSVREA